MTDLPPLTAEAERALELLLAQLEEDPAAPTSVTDRTRAREVHLADSLSGLEVEELNAAGRIADIGSGAGFPGLALAAALPQAEVVLIESVGRKCDYIVRAAERAGLANTLVARVRAEDAAAEHREAFGAVTARAVGSLPELAELASPLLAEGGVLVAWKGAREPDGEEALAAARPALAMELDRVVPVVPFPGSRKRHLYVVRKTGPTPPGLPRRAGMAKKRPFGGERSG